MHNYIKQAVRAKFSDFAVFLDRVTRSRITASDVTWVGFVAHVPIAYLIASGQLLLAGILLAFFGLFDTLDGALARVQKTASPAGMFLDASTDRLKEVLLYTGLAAYFLEFGPDWAAVASVLACGASLSVSYVKAKGEAALASQKKQISHDKLNRLFDDGIGSFETRILVLVIGCVAAIPDYAVGLVCALALYTLAVRFARISKALQRV